MKWLSVGVIVLCVVGVALADAKPNVSALIKELQDKDDIVRLKAAKALGKLGAEAKAAIPALTAALKDPDEDVRSVAKKALASIKEAVSAADKDAALDLLKEHLKGLKSPNAKLRAESVSGLAKLLKSDDDIVRARAARGLGSAGVAAKPAVKDIDAATKDPEELVRGEARKALASINAAVAAEKRELAKEKLAPLLKQLKDKAPSVRQKALEAIAELGDDGVIASEELIKTLLNAKVPALRQSALDALEKVNPPLHKPVLTLLVDRDLSAKADAITDLGKMEAEGKPAIPLLVQFYAAQSGYDRSIGGANYFGVGILQAMKRIDPEGKDFHRLLLGAVAVSAASFPPGSRFIADSHVRKKAVEMVLEAVKEKTIKPDRAVKLLIGALNDGECRIQAIKALGELGVDAKDAIPALTKLKVNPDKSTREAAAAALKKIM